MIALTLCGSSATAPIRPHLSMRRNTDPPSIFENSSQARKASTGRPTTSALSPASAEEVLVRRSRNASTGRVGPSGVDGSAGTGARCSKSSTRSRAISERRRPPKPKASSNSARSRRSIALPRPQVAGRESRMSRVIAAALFRAGGGLRESIGAARCGSRGCRKGLRRRASDAASPRVRAGAAPWPARAGRGSVDAPAHAKRRRPPRAYRDRDFSRVLPRPINDAR